MSFKEYDEHGNRKIKCEVCGHFYHQLSVHLSSVHGMSVDEYKTQYPGAPTISDFASKRTSEAQKKAKRQKVVDNGEENNNNFDPAKPLMIGPAELFVRSDLNPEDVVFVPIHDDKYQLDMEMFTILAVGVQEHDNILVHGPTGCGKSAAFLELASIINQPVRRVNLNGDIRAADFTGEKVLDVDEDGNSTVVWKDGVLPECVRKGYWLLLDELDAAQPHIMFVLQAILEKGGKLTLTGNNGEVVERHSNFRIMATANTIGRGDDTGLYTGTNIQNEATLDRFGVVYKAEYLDVKSEAKVVRDKSGVDKSVADKMVEVAAHIRSAFEQEQCYCSCSTRRLIEWAAKSVALSSVKLAAKVTVLDRLGKDDAAFVHGVIQRIMGI